MLTPTKNLERINAKIDPSAVNLVMDMLAKNYNDPIPSAIREYVANGVDTHRKENRKKRVLLHLPEEGNEMITVTDFGEGLSLDEIKEIYANFGISTKRDDNTQIGSFGIGSKAGLAIANEVNITSRKNGKETSFSLIRDKKGIATLLKEETTTHLPSGTIITIPHDVFDEMTTKRIRRMLSGWSKEEVFVTNLQTDLNDYRIPDVSKTYPEGYIIPHKDLQNVAQYSEGAISVGGVLFPIFYGKLENKMNHAEREEYESFVHYTSHIILRLPIEEAEIAYSRERIIESNEMLYKLKEQLMKMVARVRKKTYDTVEKQPTLAKALRYLDENGFALSKLIEKEHLFYATNTPLRPEIIQKEKEDRRVTWIKHTPKRIAVVQSTTEERSYGLMRNTWLCKNRENTIPTVLVDRNNLTAEEKRKLRTVGYLLWGDKEEPNKTTNPNLLLFQTAAKRYKTFYLLHDKETKNYAYKDQLPTLEDLFTLIPKKRKNNTNDMEKTTVFRKTFYFGVLRTIGETIEAMDETIPVIYGQDIKDILQAEKAKAIPRTLQKRLYPFYRVGTKKALEYINANKQNPILTRAKIEKRLKEAIEQTAEITTYYSKGDANILELISRKADEIFPYLNVNASCDPKNYNEVLRYADTLSCDKIHFQQLFREKWELYAPSYQEQEIFPECAMIGMWSYPALYDPNTIKTFLNLFPNRLDALKERIELLYQLYTHLKQKGYLS